MEYKHTKNELNEVRNDQIQRISDGAVIPFDEDNTDYQEYLKWVAKGNKAIEVDEA